MGRSTETNSDRDSSADVDEAIFIGIDLAWSDRNRTGVAIMRGERLVAWSGRLTDDRSILDFLMPFITCDRPAIIGVDAPLRVPNLSGSRHCDRALSAEWARYEAGALPANRRLLARNDIVRGEALTAKLNKHFGVEEVCRIPRRTEGRVVCEIYPHPAHVSLFGLDKTLKYKRRGARSYEKRLRAYRDYQHCLRHLVDATPGLKGAEPLIDADVDGLRGRALQEFEESLDALTCAYVVAYLWANGPERARTYGNLPDGHIIVPVTPLMAQRLEG
jgi:predicted RNase H-like nuclease